MRAGVARWRDTVFSYLTVGLRPHVVLVLAAALVVLPLYWQSLSFGLFWEDFAVLRPWSRADLLTAFWGLYRPAALDAVFYRPLTSLYYAIAFDLFGLNSRALHVIPLVNLTLIGWGVGLFVLRETRSLKLGLAATVLYCAHPQVATSIGPWIANQYHAFQTMAALAALLWWQFCRTRAPIYWLPIVLPLTAAALFKEDGFMLILAIPAIQFIRSGMIGDLQPPSRTVVAGFAGLFVMLITLRSVALGGVGGYPEPWVDSAVSNLGFGWKHVLVWQSGETPFRYIVLAIKLAGLAGAVLVLRHAARWRPLSALVITGGTLAILCNLPLVIASSTGRLQLVALGWVIMLAGALPALVRTLHFRPWPATLALAVGLAGLVATSDHRLKLFAKCSPTTLYEIIGADDRGHLKWASEYPRMPPELRERTAAQSQSCEAESFIVDHVPIVTFGVAHNTPPGASVYRSREGWLTLLVSREATGVRFTVRHLAATAAAPITATISSGSESRRVRLTSPAWQEIDMPIGTSLLTRWRRMNRIDIQTDGGVALGPSLELRAPRVGDVVLSGSFQGPMPSTVSTLW